MDNTPPSPGEPEEPLTDSAGPQIEPFGEPSASSSSWPLDPHLSSYLPDRETPEPAADSIPGYSIVHEIHRGGQGVVYQAIQKTTRRKVAIKVMREGPFASRHERDRFEREIHVLAALKHPNIVTIHESGTAGGSFYFVMDYISGNALDAYMSEGRVKPAKTGRVRIRETLSLFKKICEAVNAAHLRGVIHRDLKPGNIRMDTDGEPKILDFGLAKVAPGVLDDDSMAQTETGQFLGTPAWASPEQAEGVPGKIDVRTDVYSLGVILYHMLTGDFPYVTMGGFREVADRIMNAPPVPPRALRREIDDEVETIVLKSLAKERDRRYQSAGELARDIGHYLAGEPIEAKRDSTWYILRKHLRQYRLPLAVGAGFVAMLAVGLLLSLALLRQARVAEALAAAARDGERKQREIAEEQGSLARSRERIAQAAYAEGALDQGTALHLAGRGQDARGAFKRAREALLAVGRSPLPAEVGLYRSFRAFEAPINTLTGHSQGLMAVAWLPDGRRACSASEDGTIRLWDVRGGRELEPPFRGHAGAVHCLAVSRDGRHLLSGGEDRTVRLWDIETRQEVMEPLREPMGQVRGVALSSDGRWALSAPADEGGAVRLWDLQSRELRSLLPGDADEYTYYGVAFSPDGQSALATTYQKEIWIWDLASPEAPRKLSGHLGYVISAVFSPDGRRVLSGSFDQTLILWDARSGAPIRSFKGHTAGVRGVEFVGRGETAFSCSMDGSLRLWQVQTGDMLRTFVGHREGVRGVAVSPDGLRALSAGMDGTLRVWSLERNAEAPLTMEADTVTSLHGSPDGTTFVSGDADGTVRLYDLATFRVLQTFSGHPRPIDTATVLPDGQRLLTADNLGECRLWDVLSGRELRTFPEEGPGERRNLRGGTWCFTSVSPDGRYALRSRPDHTMDLRSLDSGEIVRPLLPARSRHIMCVVIAPDSKHALCGDEGGEIHYWDLETGQCLLTHPAVAKTASVDCIVFTADGRSAITGGHELLLRQWDLTSFPLRKVNDFLGPTLVVESIGLGRGDRTLFSVGRDQTFRMWDVPTARELSLPAQLPMDCYALAVVPPGDAVLTGSGPFVSLWDTSRSLRHLEFEPRLETARTALRSHADDGPALATLGEWYAFRGVDDWAVDLLVRARETGVPVSSLTLARCYWQLDQMTQAAREFRRALAAHEAPESYLRLCLTAVESAPAPRPTTIPATHASGDHARR